MGIIEHCKDCEEYLSSHGLAEYVHTCRCYCKKCTEPSIWEKYSNSLNCKNCHYNLFHDISLGYRDEMKISTCCTCGELWRVLYNYH